MVDGAHEPRAQWSRYCGSMHPVKKGSIYGIGWFVLACRVRRSGAVGAFSRTEHGHPDTSLLPGLPSA